MKQASSLLLTRRAEYHEHTRGASTEVQKEFGSKGEVTILPVQSERKNIQIGLMENGKDIVVISTGNILETTLEASKVLKKENVCSKVVSMHTIKPIEREIIIKCASENSTIVSIEEHSKIGGLGSHIASVIFEERLNIKYLQIALPDKFIHTVGSQNYLKKLYGLRPDQITRKILDFYKRG